MGKAPVSYMKLMDLTRKRDHYFFFYLSARRYETLDEADCRRVVAFALEYVRRGPKWREKIRHVLNWYQNAFAATISKDPEKQAMNWDEAVGSFTEQEVPAVPPPVPEPSLIEVVSK